MFGRKSRELVPDSSNVIDPLAEARQRLAAFEEPFGSRDDILAFQDARRKVLELEAYGPKGFDGRLQAVKTGGRVGRIIGRLKII